MSFMLKISNTYQHIGGGSCRHDAVLWDIGQSEQTTGPHDIPPQPESQEPEGEKPVVDSSALLKEVRHEITMLASIFQV